MLPEPLRPKQLHHFHTWPSQGPNPSPPGQPQEQTPVDDPHAELEIMVHLTSNTVLISGPAVGAAQILIWSYSCVFLQIFTFYLVYAKLK